MVKHYRKALADQQNTIIGESVVELLIDSDICQIQECSLGRFVVPFVVCFFLSLHPGTGRFGIRIKIGI